MSTVSEKNSTNYAESLHLKYVFLSPIEHVITCIVPFVFPGRPLCIRPADHGGVLNDRGHPHGGHGATPSRPHALAGGFGVQRSLCQLS